MDWSGGGEIKNIVLPLLNVLEFSIVYQKEELFSCVLQGRGFYAAVSGVFYVR